MDNCYCFCLDTKVFERISVFDVIIRNYLIPSRMKHTLRMDGNGFVDIKNIMI